MKKGFLILMTFCFFFTVQAQQTINGSFLHDNVLRSYILYIPAGYTGSNPVPLLLNFHGYVLSAQEQLDRSDFRSIADTAQFIVVHPQGTLFQGNTHWNVGGWTLGSTADDIGFTLSLIDSLSAQYNIDSSRVYSTGFSNGGFFSFKLACQVGERIAAIASVGGSMTPQTFSNCDPEHFTPVLQLHGTADNTVPYNGAGFSRPVNTILDYWVEFNEADTPAIINSLPDIDSTDGSTAEHFIYTNSKNGAPVEHFRLNGDGHNWPGFTGNMDIDASVEIWKFLSRYTLDSLGQPIPSGFIKGNEQLAIIYPNPASSSFRLESKNGKSVDQVKLISTRGERYQLSSDNMYEFDVSNFPVGIYQLRYRNEGEVFSLRLAIE